MRLPTDQRERLFNTAKSINPTLGDLFQNAYNLDAEHIQAEITELQEVYNLKKNLMEVYLEHLQALLVKANEEK